MDGIDLEKATQILTSNISEISEVEEIPLLFAVGRVLAEDFFATLDNPPFNRSPLDGYALNSNETRGAAPERPKIFRVVGEECAGDFFADEVHVGEALRIMTGAAIPAGTDCVIRQEDVIFDGEKIFVPYELKHHENFCFAGEDFRAGTLLVKANTKLTAKRIAFFAAQGVATVKVFRLPRIGIASTGDEIIEAGEKISAGKIYNSNLYLLSARLIELGFSPKILGNLPDDAERISEKLSALNLDLLITTGGVSVGKKDVMHAVVARIGEKLFWRVQMKPGAPVLSWRCRNFLGVSLSGNPFAAAATFELLVRPVLAKLSRCREILPKRTNGILVDSFPKKSFGRRFIRARFDDGKIFLPTRHESGNLFSAAECNALVDIPAGSNELSAGDAVEVVLL